MPYSNQGFTTINKTEPGVAGAALVSAVDKLKAITGKLTEQVPDLDWTLVNTDLWDTVPDPKCGKCGAALPYSLLAGRDGFEIHVSESQLAQNPDALTHAVYHAVCHVMLERWGYPVTTHIDAVRQSQLDYNANPNRTSTKDDILVNARLVAVLKARV